MFPYSSALVHSNGCESWTDLCFTCEYHVARYGHQQTAEQRHCSRDVCDCVKSVQGRGGERFIDKDGIVVAYELSISSFLGVRGGHTAKLITPIASNTPDRIRETACNGGPLNSGSTAAPRRTTVVTIMHIDTRAINQLRPRIHVVTYRSRMILKA
jgi:hypothetical protein